MNVQFRKSLVSISENLYFIGYETLDRSEIRKEMKQKRILVIIITFNGIAWIEKCLKSLAVSTIPVSVLVIDNGSTDGTQIVCKQNPYIYVELLQNDKNLGFGYANNIGLQKVLNENYDYAYLLNQDAWIMPETIELLVNTHCRHPEYGVLSPMQLQANGKHFDRNFLTNVVRNSQISSQLLEEDLYFERLSDIYEVNFVMAAHWLISRKCIEIVGGFSPTFPHYGEDDNYLHRCQYWGMKVGIVPTAKAVHDREFREITTEKFQYIIRYVEALKKASHPLQPIHIDRFIKTYIRRGIFGHDKYMRQYAFRLMKERNNIICNRSISMNRTTAFLNTKIHD